MMMLLGSTLKVSALILAGLAGAAAARRHSAAARHWVIAASLLCALAIPVLERYVPSWTIPTTSTALQTVDDGRRLSTGPASAVAAPVEVDVAVTVAAAPSARAAALAAWLVWGGGFAFCILVLTVGLLRLAWIAAHAQTVTDGPWPRLMQQIGRDLGIRPPVRLLDGSTASTATR